MRRQFVSICLILVFMSVFIPSSLANKIPDAYTLAKPGVSENVFLYQDSGYQVEYRYDIWGKFRDTITRYVDNYNEMLGADDVDVWFYFINNSRSMDFTEDLSLPNPVYTRLCEMLTCADHTACLEIDSFDTYMNWFYRSDHHWNHRGSQQGYEDVLRFLGCSDEPYLPVEEVVFDVPYNGSYSQRTGIADDQELFTVYRYNLPEKTSFVSGKKKAIGRSEQYFAGKYKKDRMAPHWANFYGGDVGEIVYDTGMEDRENLLILCNSYGASVRELISAHYHRTYVVDMREYMNTTGKGMKIREYIREHQIDKVLILADVSYFLYGKLLH